MPGQRCLRCHVCVCNEYNLCFEIFSSCLSCKYISPDISCTLPTPGGLSLSSVIKLYNWYVNNSTCYRLVGVAVLMFMDFNGMVKVPVFQHLKATKCILADDYRMAPDQHDKNLLLGQQGS